MLKCLPAMQPGERTDPFKGVADIFIFSMLFKGSMNVFAPLHSAAEHSANTETKRHVGGPPTDSISHINQSILASQGQLAENKASPLFFSRRALLAIFKRLSCYLHVVTF